MLAVLGLMVMSFVVGLVVGMNFENNVMRGVIK